MWCRSVFEVQHVNVCVVEKTTVVWTVLVTACHYALFGVASPLGLQVRRNTGIVCPDFAWPAMVCDALEEVGWQAENPPQQLPLHLPHFCAAHPLLVDLPLPEDSCTGYMLP